MKLGKRHKKEIRTQKLVRCLFLDLSTAYDSKPKPRSTNHSTRSLPVSKSSCVTITTVPKADQSKSSSSFSDSKHFVCSTCHKCVLNANPCITKLLKEMNSRAKIQSHKTKNRNKPVDQKSHTQKPGRHIFTGHRFSPNKTSAVYEKTSPRSDLRWKPTGRIFKSVGLRWIPTGKLFDSCTSKVHSEPPHGSNVDIPNIHECKQTLDTIVTEKADISETIIKVDSQMMIQKNDSWKVYSVICSTNISNGENQVVSKSSVVTTADASDKRQQQLDSTSSTSTLATTVTADGNLDFKDVVILCANIILKLLGFMRVNVLSKCINTTAIANTMRFTTVHFYVLPGDGRGLWKVVLNIEVIYGSFYDLAMIME
ncbi:hypothetical protein Tco_0248058 [Tanacetum coccineum]